MSSPELIAFSEYKIGGVQNFYWNILSNAPHDNFDRKWVFYDNDNNVDPKPLEPYGICEEIIIKMPLHDGERIYSLASRLQKLISRRPGVLLTNFPAELYTLHLYRRRKKTVYFVCHDENYLPFAVQFAFLIDVFIAHNEYFYQRLRELLPGREDQVFYKPYGVAIPSMLRKANPEEPLKIVIAARLQPSKGILDIPVIDDMLQQQGVKVKWTIVGDGTVKQQVEDIMLPRGNCRFFKPANNKAVVEIMQQNDVFILPSRLDGLPVAMLEAMSVGCVPVISAFNEGIRKVVTSTEGYVLPVGDNEAFTHAIMDLHNNRNMLEEKSRASRQRVEQEYDVRMRAKEYFDLFDQYKSFKRKYVYKSSNYGGYADHPAIPAFIRKPVKKIKNLFSARHLQADQSLK